MQTLNWQSRKLLSCACNGEVFLGIPAAKTASGDPWISATITYVQEVCSPISGCKEYIYTFEYDECQLTANITAIDITDVLCKSLLTQMVGHSHSAAFGITIDGDGDTPSLGSRSITIPYSCRAAHWYLVADDAGAVMFDLKVSGVSIVGAGTKPFLFDSSSGDSAVDWDTTQLAEGTIVELVLDEASGISWVNLVVKVIKD